MSQKAQRVLGSQARYKVLYGGRGGGKSYAIADALICNAVYNKLLILCTREMQNSIKDSVHRLLVERINALGFDDYFVVQKDLIRSRSGSEFIFKGLHHNIKEIKSTEGIDICWVEEAEAVVDDSWTTLIPTIRKEGSQIIVSFNPESDKSATYLRFIKNTPPDCAIAFMSYGDNMYFSNVLRKEMEYDKRVDYEKYLHIWEGQVKKYGAACIFHKKIKVEDFETPEGVRLFFGVDWGFSNDPTAVGRMFIQDNKLYIDQEFYAVGIEINELERAFDVVPGIRRGIIVGDSARPDTISHMKNLGFNIRGAKKGKGSVEDGIEYLRGFEAIVIHPRCKGAKGDFTNYKWKQDKLTKEVLPIPADGSDHWPDLARYALEDYIKHKEYKVRWL